MNEISGNNLSDLCRVCLEKSPKLYPLEGSIANVDVFISTMITYCTSVEVVVDEHLPKGVCISCFKIVRIAYNFIKDFRETNSQLLAARESINNRANIKEEPHEEIQIDEVVVNDHLGNLHDFPQEENITLKYVDKDTNNSDYKSTVQIRLESDEDCISENNESVEMRDNSNRTLLTQSLYKLECPVCSVAIFSEFNRGLVRHLHRCHKNSLFKCNKCSLEVELTVDLYVRHYSKAHLYRCPTCSRQLRTKNSFYNHMKSHTEGQNHRCPHQNCGKSFRSKLGLKKHLHIHSNIAKYVCSTCGKKFVTYDTFRYHIKTHDGTRSYLCTVCGRAFLQSVHLKYHMWHHTGVKQFHCADCGRSYTSVTQLKKHRRKYCGSEGTNENLKSK